MNVRDHLAQALARIGQLEHENAVLRESADRMVKISTGLHVVLNRIYSVLDGESWEAESCSEIAEILEHAGYTIHAPGEPEPFIHGDADTGAEG